MPVFLYSDSSVPSSVGLNFFIRIARSSLVVMDRLPKILGFSGSGSINYLELRLFSIFTKFLVKNEEKP